ncbi:tellurite resistance TerB family protein [Roseitranquillus sediminis]|uniref:tellurite resistance TerB family protein n=1 Tax=Roseitranquillus sediminis TaxID=2809051 RepID=UPI001D0C3B8B|nr:tellurite resistance TerB family protein [Roseitranquillus sediminis]MBM9595289.1 tellurite resistance TerB family protein [Roseitranquillus sediminis]
MSAANARRCTLSDFEENMTPQDGLIAVMMAVSASDERIRTPELVTIERIVNHLPAFANYDQNRMPDVSSVVFDHFAEEDGLDSLFETVRRALPERLYETAYALACDVAVSDGRLGEIELRLLEEIRYELKIDRLHAAAIERSARARHMIP